MALSDFFIGKPGPGSISEALQLHLPVIVECNGKTLPQERYNAEWVAERGFGMVVDSFRKIAPRGREFDEGFRSAAIPAQCQGLFESSAVRGAGDSREVRRGRGNTGSLACAAMRPSAISQIGFERARLQPSRSGRLGMRALAPEGSEVCPFTVR
jgi:hypothetical protein